MAKLLQLSLTILFALLLVQHTLCADPPELSPSPPPELGADSHSPSPSPAVSSPPAPPPSGQTPAHSPANSSSEKTPPPAPASAPNVASDIGRNNVNGSEKSHSGLSGGQKAGIVIGVLAAACMVGLGCILYRKRQQNIQRSQYGYAARREIL